MVIALEIGVILQLKTYTVGILQADCCMFISLKLDMFPDLNQGASD